MKNVITLCTFTRKGLKPLYVNIVQQNEKLRGVGEIKNYEDNHQYLDVKSYACIWVTDASIFLRGNCKVEDNLHTNMICSKTKLFVSMLKALPNMKEICKR